MAEAYLTVYSVYRQRVIRTLLGHFQHISQRILCPDTRTSLTRYRHNLVSMRKHRKGWHRRHRDLRRQPLKYG